MVSAAGRLWGGGGVGTVLKESCLEGEILQLDIAIPIAAGR
jgi:hypothetical protein